MSTIHNNARLKFISIGTCSHTMFYLLNYESGLCISDEERASDLLAGGLMSRGYQCGMLWGASLAAGNYAFNQNTDLNQSIGAAIHISQNIITSFSNCSGTVNCSDFTKCKWNNPLSIAKYFVSGGFFKCMNLTATWAPEALDIVRYRNRTEESVNTPCISCASEVIKKAGGSNKDAVMVAGFAGGLGLSGNACGALGAAVWYKMLQWCRNNPGKTPQFFKNPLITLIFERFSSLTENQFECRTICGKTHSTPGEHSDYIVNGGCQKLINGLSELCRIK
jgi:hypothetical protein